MTTKSKSPKTNVPLSANGRLIALKNRVDAISHEVTDHHWEYKALNERVTIVASIACSALLVAVVEGYIIVTRLY